MKQTIVFQSKTLSINSTYYGNKLHGKTPEAQQWTTNMMLTIGRYKAEFDSLRTHFNPKKHVYSFKMKIFIPESVMYTKDGKMTSLVHDLSNVEKSCVDVIFLPKFYAEESLFGLKAPNLNIDDRYLQYLSSEKIPTEDYWGIEVELEIKDKPTCRRNCP
jgi:hypothetical protein